MHKFNLFQIPMTICDIHKPLLNCYKWIRDDVKSVIKNLPKEKDKEIYKTFKEYCQNDSAISAGKFLYLNRNSFFGLGGWMNADRYARESVIKRLKYFSPAGTSISSLY